MNIITTTDGKQIDLDSAPQTLVYNGDGTLQYTQLTFRTTNYRQTLTYTSGKITAISGWVKQ